MIPAEPSAWHPVAVLIDRRGFDTLIPLKVGYSPPRELLLPHRAGFSMSDSEASQMPTPHRVFRLTEFRSKDHRWWKVYNEGRCRTPEDGYVYFEADAVPD